MHKLVALLMIGFFVVSLSACGIKGDLVRPSQIKEKDQSK